MESGREYGLIKVPTSLVSHIICMFVAVALVVIASIYTTPRVENFSSLAPLQLSQEWNISTSAVVLNIVLMALITVLLSIIANKYSLTTLLSLFPTLFFLMPLCCNPTILQSFNVGMVGAVALFVSTYYLFENYGKKRVEQMAYTVTFLLCATTILWDKIIFFMPLFLLGMGQLNLLTIKSAAASILAIITVAFILWASTYLEWGYFNFESSWEGIKSVFLLEDYNAISQISIYEVLYIAPILIVVLIYNLTNLYADTREKISIKRYIQFVNTILVTTILLIILNPLNINSYMPIFYASSSLLAAHYFNSIKSKAKLIFLYSIILAYITSFVLWIL